MTRRQLADEQWTLMPSLPIGGFGPYPERLRDQFEGVLWRFRSSAQWREVPDGFGPWSTVFGRFRVWRDAGVFTALLEGLIAAPLKGTVHCVQNRARLVRALYTRLDRLTGPAPAAP